MLVRNVILTYFVMSSVAGCSCDIGKINVYMIRL